MFYDLANFVLAITRRLTAIFIIAVGAIKQLVVSLGCPHGRACDVRGVFGENC